MEEIEIGGSDLLKRTNSCSGKVQSMSVGTLALTASPFQVQKEKPMPYSPRELALKDTTDSWGGRREHGCNVSK